MIFSKYFWVLIIWIWCRVVVKIDMHQNGNLVSMPMHTLHSVLHFKTIVFCKINKKTIVLAGKYLMHCLKCLSSHLAMKLCLTKCCNFGYRYSMNSCDVVFLYIKVNFFNGWPFLAIVVSRAKQHHWIMFEYDLVTSFRHKDNFCTL